MYSVEVIFETFKTRNQHRMEDCAVQARLEELETLLEKEEELVMELSTTPAFTKEANQLGDELHELRFEALNFL